MESLFHPMTNLLERGGAVELLGDEVLNFVKPKKLACFRVLDDEGRVFWIGQSLLANNNQDLSESRFLRSKLEHS